LPRTGKQALEHSTRTDANPNHHHRFSTGALEQAITTHPTIAEACIIGMPDSLKGHVPFAFVTLSTSDAKPSPDLYAEVQKLVRDQIGAIASLGGMIVGKGMIPKTRSGKTLRRVLKEIVEKAVEGDFEAEVSVPATIEDGGVIPVVRGMVKEYFENGGVKGIGKAKL